MSLRLSDHEVLHNNTSSSSFFDLARIFSLFSLVFRTSKLLVFKELNKTIIPFALVGYETGYSQLGATRLVGYLPCHIQQLSANGITVNYSSGTFDSVLYLYLQLYNDEMYSFSVILGPV